MAIQFPANPAAQVPLNTFGPETSPLANATNDIVFTWDGAKWTGVLDTGGGGGGDASITVSETPPVSPSQGALWWDSSDDGGRLWLWYEDGNTNQWVEASPNSGGSGGVEQLIAGDNITLSPADGKGVVTINSTGGGGGGPTTPGVRYQQGDWSPGMGSAIGDSTHTYSSQEGSWSRVGNTVTCNFKVVIGGTGSNGSTPAGIFNLPYSRAMGKEGGGSLTEAEGFTGSGFNPSVVKAPSTNNSPGLWFYTYSKTDGTATVGVGRFAVGTSASGVFTYETDDTTFAPINGAVVTEDIQGTGGSGGGGSTEIYGTAKASCQFAGSDGGFFNYKNIASVTRTGVGLYQVTFNAPMASDFYTIVFGNQGAGGFIQQARSQDANGFTIRNYESNTVDLIDANVIGFAVFDDVPITVSGGGSGTTVNYNGSSAWGSVAADGTIRGGQNIASVTKSGTGTYDVVFTTPMANTDYGIVQSAEGSGGIASYPSKTVAGFQIYIRNNSGALDASNSFAVHSANAIAPPSGVGADSWGYVSSDGTLESSYNVTSVDRVGTGVYDVVLETSMPVDLYAVQVTPLVGDSTLSAKASITSNSEFTIRVYDDTGGQQNSDFCFTVHASSTVTPTYTWTRDGTTLKPANAGDDVTTTGIVRSYSNTNQVYIAPSGIAGGSITTDTFTINSNDGAAEFSNVTAEGTVSAGFGFKSPRVSGRVYNHIECTTDGFQNFKVDPSGTVGIGSSSQIVLDSTGTATFAKDIRSTNGSLQVYMDFTGISGGSLTTDTFTINASNGAAIFNGGVTQYNSYLMLEADNPANFSAKGEYTGPTLDVKELLLKLVTAADRIKALEAEVSLLKGGSD